MGEKGTVLNKMRTRREEAERTRGPDSRAVPDPVQTNGPTTRERFPVSKRAGVALTKKDKRVLKLKGEKKEERKRTDTDQCDNAKPSEKAGPLAARQLWV